MELKIEIDPKSGFCYGVVRAIDQAESYIASHGSLYSLGDIVHNGSEIERLSDKGLETIDKSTLESIKNRPVLFRAHGEPPESYKIAKNNNLQIIDCTCPVVLKLQQRVKDAYANLKSDNGQILIYGKPGHAEVNGLIGQVGGDAIIIRNSDDLEGIDYSRPINIFSQTTKEPAEYTKICKKIQERITKAGGPIERFKAFNTICNQVSSRHPHLKEFSKRHNVIIFVSGSESSNGKVLFEHCKSVNERSHKIEKGSEIKIEWFKDGDSVGICGATSTPGWLLNDVAKHIEELSHGQ